MKITQIILISCLSCTMFSCSLQKGTLQFEGKKNEIIAKDEIKAYLKGESMPSIVLRVPNLEDVAIKSDPNDYIYSAIEKELLIGGFNVKDRGLFGEVMKRWDGSISYGDIRELTGADCILELVRMDTKVKHVTNKITTKNGTEKAYDGAIITRYGANIEFKLILVKGNIFAGSYTFNYTPCTKGNNTGCECLVGYKPAKVYPEVNFCEIKDKTKDKKKRKEVNLTENAYEFVDKNVLEEFVRNGVKLMIGEIRK